MSGKTKIERRNQKIVASYKRGGLTQEDLAELFNVSRRTINRVLQEEGLISPRYEVSQAEYAMVELLRSRGISGLDQLVAFLPARKAARA